jgi:hypothetical protein
VWRIDDGNLVGAPALAVHMRIAEAAMPDNGEATNRTILIGAVIALAIVVIFIGAGGIGKTTIEGDADLPPVATGSR